MLDNLFLFDSLPANAEHGTYDWFLVLASYVVACFASYAGLTIAMKIFVAPSQKRKRVLHILGSLAIGSGIWSMHFIGMLAYKMQMEMHYDPLLTIVSMLFAVGVAYFVLYITQAVKLSMTRTTIGAMFLGLGIAGMHYTGMAAMQMHAQLYYIPAFFILSVAIAIIASGAALWIIFTLGRKDNTQHLYWMIAASMVMGAAISGMHYTGMAAAVIIPDANCVYNDHQNFDFLELAVIASTMVLMTLVTFTVSKRFFMVVGGGIIFAFPLVVIVYQAINALNDKTVMLSLSAIACFGYLALFTFLYRLLQKSDNAEKSSAKAQVDLAARLKEMERLERMMQDYTDRLELSRANLIAAKKTLEEEGAKTKAILDNILEGIVTIDANGIIQTFNKGAEKAFGYAADEMIDQPVNQLMPSPYREEYEAHLATFRETGEAKMVGDEREIRGLRKNGEIFPMAIGISQVVVGRTTFFVKVVRDITQQKEREEEFRVAKENADAANQAKSEFLANMSHELRTPLNSIIGMNRLLRDTGLSEDQTGLVDIAFRSSLNLLEIVNDILDLSKIEAGETKLEHIGFDPKYALNSVAHALDRTADEKHIRIDRFYGQENFPFVLGDPTRFTRILTNLVGNAIKYTDQGHVEMRAHCKKTDDTHASFHCEIIDTGVGIPADRLSSIFDKFVQADVSTTRKYGGTGLGLAITKQLVELMRGTIGVESKEGVGSRFWFTIPFEITDKLHEEKGIRRRKAFMGTIPLDKARILIAEDHPVNQILVRKLMQKFGITQFQIVENGLDALAAYGDGSAWDVILMDCHMPQMNGYDATAAIREKEKTTGKHVPVIATTADAMVGSKEKCMRHGMDEFIRKPINIDELKEALGQWLRFDDADESEKKRDEMIGGNEVVDLTKLKTFSEGDVEIEKELVGVFIQQSDKNLRELNDNRIDGECRPWVEAAHMFKGGSASVGALPLSRLCAHAQNMSNVKGSERATLYQQIEDEYMRVKEHLKTIGLIA